MTYINSTRSDNYLKFLPLIIGAGVLLAFLSPKGTFRNESGDPNNITLYYHYASYIACQILFWLVIGKITQNMKAALVTLMAFFVSIGLQMAHSLSKIDHVEPAKWITGLYMLAHWLIPLIFAYQTTLKGRFWEMLLFTIAVCYIPMGVSNANIISNLFRFGQFDSITEIKIPLANGIHVMLNAVDIFYDTLINIAKISIILAFVEHQNKFDFGFSDKFLNFNNSYSKTQSLVIFIATKVLIYALPFYMIQSNRHKMHDYDANSVYSDAIIPFIILLLQMVAFYIVVQFYRKFVLEFLFSKEIAPSYAYWFFLIPIIGTLIFLAIVLDGKKAVNPEKRVVSFLNASSTNSSSTIVLIISAFQLLSLMLLIMASPNFFLVMLSTVILCLFYGYSKIESTIYVFIGMCLLLFGYTFFHYESAYAETLLRMMYQIPLLYVLSGIFHIQAFEYLPNLNETGEETIENGDLLSF
jgi:hypothetical protein